MRCAGVCAGFRANYRSATYRRKIITIDTVRTVSDTVRAVEH